MKKYIALLLLSFVLLTAAACSSATREVPLSPAQALDVSKKDSLSFKGERYTNFADYQYIPFSDGCMLLCTLQYYSESELYAVMDNGDIYEIGLPTYIQTILRSVQGFLLADETGGAYLLQQTGEAYSLSQLDIGQAITDVAAFNGNENILLCEDSTAYRLTEDSLEKLDLPIEASMFTTDQYSDMVLFKGTLQSGGKTVRDQGAVYTADQGVNLVKDEDGEPTHFYPTLDYCTAFEDKLYVISASISLADQYMISRDGNAAMLDETYGSGITEAATDETNGLFIDPETGDFVPIDVEINSFVSTGDAMLYRSDINGVYMQKSGGAAKELEYVPQDEVRERFAGMTPHNTLVDLEGEQAGFRGEGLYCPDEEIEYVIWEYVSFRKVGTYTNNMDAKKVVRNVFLIDLKNQIYAQSSTEGGNPAQVIYDGAGSVGSDPDKLTLPMILSRYMGYGGIAY